MFSAPIWVHLADWHMLPQLPCTELIFTKGARPQDARTATCPPSNTAMRSVNPFIWQRSITVWASLALPGRECGLTFDFRSPPHQARRKQYNNNPIPRTKKSKNRAKKRGPINAAIRNQNLMDHYLLGPLDNHDITNLGFVECQAAKLISWESKRHPRGLRPTEANARQPTSRRQRGRRHRSIPPHPIGPTRKFCAPCELP